MVQRALKRLIAADKRRDIRTRIVALDSKTAMKRLRGRAVTDPTDPEQNKKAIDAVFRSLVPEYLE